MANESGQRIVSLVPSTTESVCELGAVARLLACTSYCTEPEPALRHVPRIGGTKNPDLQAIASLDPDLVLANAEENRPEDIEWLVKRFPTLVQTPRSIVEAGNDLRVLATRLGLLEQVEPFLLRIEAQIAAAEVAALTKPPLQVYYAIWRMPWMTINSDTFIHDVLQLCGATCVAAEDQARYPHMEPIDAVVRGVELVLLASEPWEFDESQRQQIAGAKLFGDARVALCDGRDFCWHGVRMADGLGRALAAIRGAL
ncbi:MAG: ABC-type Fe3+-hydroxamate transport system substrate-binding protein [Planctomycetota bacterium]|jgi:ABC-type Fe3+-hydroxamate transport system substrate-binding protein